MTLDYLARYYRASYIGDPDILTTVQNLTCQFGLLELDDKGDKGIISRLLSFLRSRCQFTVVCSGNLFSTTKEAMCFFPLGTYYTRTRGDCCLSEDFTTRGRCMEFRHRVNLRYFGSWPFWQPPSSRSQQSSLPAGPHSVLF